MARKLIIYRKLISIFVESVEKVKQGFSDCVKSCKKSKINFYFQVINFSLILILYWFIIPEFIEFMSRVFKGYFLSISSSIAGNFILWVITRKASLIKIFSYSRKATIALFVILLVALIVPNIKACIKVINNIKNYFIYGEVG